MQLLMWLEQPFGSSPPVTRGHVWVPHPARGRKLPQTCHPSLLTHHSTTRRFATKTKPAIYRLSSLLPPGVTAHSQQLSGVLGNKLPQPNASQHDAHTGWLILLATPQKNRVPDMGWRKKAESKNSPHVWDSVFFGVARRISHPVLHCAGTRGRFPNKLFSDLGHLSLYVDVC